MPCFPASDQTGEAEGEAIIPPDLMTVIRGWVYLPERARRRIIRMVEQTVGEQKKLGSATPLSYCLTSPVIDLNPYFASICRFPKWDNRLLSHFVHCLTSGRQFLRLNTIPIAYMMIVYGNPVARGGEAWRGTPLHLPVYGRQRGVGEWATSWTHRA